MAKNEFCVEDFGYVRPHQVADVNFHLKGQLEFFDKEYANSGGKLGSARHKFAKAEFARLASESILNCVEGLPGDLIDLQTETEMEIPHLGVTIGVKTSTDFTSGEEPEWSYDNLPN